MTHTNGDSTVDMCPVRTGRHITIRPLRPDDYQMLHEIALFTDAGSRWRLNGATPTMDQFMSVLLTDAKVTFAIETNTMREVVGMVQLWMYDAESRNGHVTAFLAPWARGRGWPLEGFLLFAEYVFSAFNLHKLYVESLDPAYEQYRSMVGTYLRPEGCLREHKWLFGRLVDFHLLALYAADVPKLMRLLRRTVAQPIGGTS